VCPGRDLGRALILPRRDTAAMAPFLAELGGHVVPGAPAVLVRDGAGGHTARDPSRPGDVSPRPLPPDSPGLNPRERRVWEFLRQRYLALRRFPDHAALLEACQDAWRRFIGTPGRVRSLRSAPIPGPPSRDFSETVLVLLCHELAVG
jgi:hypothetical protein